MAENQFNKKIKKFQCDGGGEFNLKAFLLHLENCGIQIQMSCPGTLEQNGVAEREHRHIVETSLTLLFHANLSLHLLVDAFLIVMYLINRLPIPILNNSTPYFELYNKTPNYGGLRVFGCRCFPSLCHHSHNKFERKTYPCIFLGYSIAHKGYRCLHPSTNRVYILRHVVFDETEFPFVALDKEQRLPAMLQLSEYSSSDEWLNIKSNVDVEDFAGNKTSVTNNITKISSSLRNFIYDDTLSEERPHTMKDHNQQVVTSPNSHHHLTTQPVQPGSSSSLTARNLEQPQTYVPMNEANDIS